MEHFISHSPAMKVSAVSLLKSRLGHVYHVVTMDFIHLKDLTYNHIHCMKGLLLCDTANSENVNTTVVCEYH